MKPKLRPIEVRPLVDRGQPVLMLRDPLAVSDKAVILPQALGPLLALCDGSRDVTELYAALLVRTGLRVTREVIQRLVDHLDDALLLENDRFAHAYAETLRAYRAASFRRPALAGLSYPDDPATLWRLLDDYLVRASLNGTGTSRGQLTLSSSGTQSVPPPLRGAKSNPAGRPTDILGLISPHIDYQRGGSVYAGVWSQAAEAVRAADLVIIFGTDHSGSAGYITLTRQHYATPYGTLPTATDIVDAIAAAIGEEAAFAEEIHHRGEHSIELATVWLHHVRGGQPCEVVPILCGSFHQFVEGCGGSTSSPRGSTGSPNNSTDSSRGPAEGQFDPATDPTLNATLNALRTAIAGRQVVIVAAADLAHIGPAFNDSFPIDRIRYAQLQVADEILIQAITEGDADIFFRTIAAEGDRRNICGLPPIYLTLRLLNGNVRGELTGYDRCPADEQNTSFVSVCGVVLRKSTDLQNSKSANE